MQLFCYALGKLSLTRSSDPEIINRILILCDEIKKVSMAVVFRSRSLSAAHVVCISSQNAKLDKQRLKDLSKFILQVLALDDVLQSPLPTEDIVDLEREIQHLVIDGRKLL